MDRFSAAQVCEIITGDDGEVDFMFPGSDDELDALELTDGHETNGRRDNLGVLDALDGENIDSEPQLPGNILLPQKAQYIM